MARLTKAILTMARLTTARLTTAILTTTIPTKASGGFRLIQMLNRAVQPASSR